MTIEEQSGALLGTEVVSASRLHGGDLSAVWRLGLADGRTAVAKQGSMVETEAAMLRAIAKSGAPAPDVYGCEGELLVMEWIEGSSGAGSGWSDLARVLDILHACHGRQYGWHDDYAFGTVEIRNESCTDWPQFWAERRILPFTAHVSADLAHRLEALAASLPDHLPRSPSASLLHGDLWGGNVLHAGKRITALIDPACYHGDREVDTAMLTLFDRPDAQFFDRLALETGWHERQPAYRLWPLLVHLRLFGNAYRGGVEACLRQLGH